MTAGSPFSYWPARIGRRFGGGRRTDPDELAGPALMNLMCIEAIKELGETYANYEADFGDQCTTLIARGHAPEVALAAALHYSSANDPA